MSDPGAHDLFHRPRIHLLLLLAVCLRMSTPVQAQAPTELRIGYQKSSVNLLVARRLGLLERRFPGTHVQWIEFPAGPQLLEALGAGSLDFGMTGDTPPIFAQAAGRELLYVGREPPKPRCSAILVTSQSRIASLSELRGKRIAFQKGSSAHYLVLRALEKGGVALSEVQTVHLSPADARAALESHGVDAWAIWDPYWAAAAQDTDFRVLTTAEGLSNDNTFYESPRSFTQQHPEVIRGIFGAINEAAEYVNTRPADVSTWIAAATGIGPRAAAAFLARRPYSPVESLNSAAVAEQQAIADTFAKAGLIPHPITVAEAVWHPESAAR